MIRPDFTKLQALKSAFEGFESVAYQDSGGVWTVGSGHTWHYDKQRKIKQGDTINKTTDALWLALKYEATIKEIQQYIKADLNPDQAAAICDYVYNRGIGNFLKTQLDELINTNPNDRRIAEEIMGTGLKDRAGQLLWGLGRRRYAEAWLYFRGEIKTDFSRWEKPKF